MRLYVYVCVALSAGNKIPCLSPQPSGPSLAFSTPFVILLSSMSAAAVIQTASPSDNPPLRTPSSQLSQIALARDQSGEALPNLNGREQTGLFI
ncbi:hypothetical protein BDN71DRAFT_1457709 [Pleurotus eryngii]|uniref:Uncharacterized protein n=1 Tax=Pleurotus eryngii TaxID=5323 RepID=A0A9P6D231_PLEER|nr:hypothetical protein BDN71DRAFT_1457709 [Pleurotus eryngii]